MPLISQVRIYGRALAAWLAVVLAVVLSAPALAAPNHIRASIVAEGPARPGGTIMLALLMQPDKGWHGYWINPGDAGYGLTLDWNLPAGFRTDAPQFPVPQTLLISGLMNHVYEHDYAVLIPLKVPDNAAGTAPFSLKANWLACTDEICVPERAELEGAVMVGENGPVDSRFAAWRATLPAPLGQTAAYEASAQKLRIGVPFPAAAAIENPHLFISDSGLIAYAANQTFLRHGDTLIIELERTKAPGGPVPATIGGVLSIGGTAGGLAFTAKPGPVPQGGEPIAAPDLSLATLAVLLGGALLGGLVLNVMPCVFPVLSLKALTLARSGHSGTAARSEGLAYTAGVMAACLALGAGLLALRAAGEQVGWAFQLQEPGVVAVLILLATAITANFAGLFELPGLSPERGAGPSGAFGTGLLAAFIATPCTGPFMAAAMGAALVLPTGAALAVFAALGLGLALPFLLLGFIPALRRMLPKPGAWMERFRRAMAIPMGLTGLALVWLASRLGGGTFAALATVAALALLAVLIVAGRGQNKGGSVFGWALPVSLAIVALSGTIAPRYASAGQSAGSEVLNAQAFSENALAKARASGKPVFAYFTADWCLSCKVNESVAIEREATRAAFEKAGVIVLRGDWTRRDAAITRFLTTQGAAGVPLYLWYPATGGAPQQLPQVLGPDSLTDLALVR